MRVKITMPEYLARLGFSEAITQRIQVFARFRTAGKIDTLVTAKAANHAKNFIFGVKSSSVY